jgi:hypothetical protein
VTVLTNAVPLAVVALRDALGAAFPAPPDPAAASVLLGTQPNRFYTGRLITVAEKYEPDLDAISVDRAEAGAGRRVQETIGVACSVFVGSANRDYDGWRAGAGEILATVDQALLTDATLLAVVSRARRDFTRWMDVWSEDGGAMGVVVDFLVELVVLS